MFSGMSAYVVPLGMGNARKAALERQLTSNGAVLVDRDNIKASNHIFIDDGQELARIWQFLGATENVVRSSKCLYTKWIVLCVKEKRLMPADGFEIDHQKISGDFRGDASESSPSSGKKCSKSAGVVEEESATSSRLAETSSPLICTHSTSKRTGNDADKDNVADSIGGQSPAKRGRFVYETASNDETNKLVNHNQHITDQLQVLAAGYKSTNDKWRALTYEKAIQTLKHLPKRIQSKEECHGLRGIGVRLADKIWEICETGELRKADEFNHSERIQTLNRFTNIWGVGPHIAEQWYQQGYRTLEDIEIKANLNRQQRIGLKLYDDLLQRMPRNEAADIVKIVTKAVAEMNGGLICVACGSYRREKETCGDVDILITHNDGESHKNILPKLVDTLTKSGFLTDHLVECEEEGNHRKYMGVCRLPCSSSSTDQPPRLHRRIDIITVPYDEYATSLIYFTGSAHFTRSIYAKAKSMGMRLNQHGLRGGVMRQAGETLNAGYHVETETEEAVFEALGIPYRTPVERDHP